MKYKHYTLKEFLPKLDADMAFGKKHVALTVWINSQIIFSRECADEAEAMEILNGFGHGFEYLGVGWAEVK